MIKDPSAGCTHDQIISTNADGIPEYELDINAVLNIIGMFSAYIRL